MLRIYKIVISSSFMMSRRRRMIKFHFWKREMGEYYTRVETYSSLLNARSNSGSGIGIQTFACICHEFI